MIDSPNVRMPPPLYYAAAVILGYLLDRRWPLPIGRGTLTATLATMLLVAAFTLMLSGVATFRRSGTSVLPIRAATTLVITGPYLVTRNPMYLGLAMLTVSVGLYLHTWWPILLLAPIVILIQEFVIKREEAYLVRRFGNEYRTYMHRVRRWI